jgi:hypothetical protein
MFNCVTAVILNHRMSISEEATESVTSSLFDALAAAQVPYEAFREIPATRNVD